MAIFDQYLAICHKRIMIGNTYRNSYLLYFGAISGDLE